MEKICICACFNEWGCGLPRIRLCRWDECDFSPLLESFAVELFVVATRMSDAHYYYYAQRLIHGHIRSYTHTFLIVFVFQPPTHCVCVCASEIPRSLPTIKIKRHRRTTIYEVTITTTYIVRYYSNTTHIWIWIYGTTFVLAVWLVLYVVCFNALLRICSGYIVVDVIIVMHYNINTITQHIQTRYYCFLNVCTNRSFATCNKLFSTHTPPFTSHLCMSPCTQTFCALNEINKKKTIVFSIWGCCWLLLIFFVLIINSMAW